MESDVQSCPEAGVVWAAVRPGRGMAICLWDWVVCSALGRGCCASLHGWLLGLLKAVCTACGHDSRSHGAPGRPRSTIPLLVLAQGREISPALGSTLSVDSASLSAPSLPPLNKDSHSADACSRWDTPACVCSHGAWAG